MVHPARIAQAIAEEERSGVESLWWLSFADPEKPEGEQFLGTAIVSAFGFVSAVDRTHRLGINPGGEVAGEPIPDDYPIPEDQRDRLMSRDELRRSGLLVGHEHQCITCGRPVDRLGDDCPRCREAWA